MELSCAADSPARSEPRQTNSTRTNRPLGRQLQRSVTRNPVYPRPLAHPHPPCFPAAAQHSHSPHSSRAPRRIPSELLHTFPIPRSDSRTTQSAGRCSRICLRSTFPPQSTANASTTAGLTTLPTLAASHPLLPTRLPVCCTLHLPLGYPQPSPPSVRPLQQPSPFAPTLPLRGSSPS